MYNGLGYRAEMPTLLCRPLRPLVTLIVATASDRPSAAEFQKDHYIQIWPEFSLRGLLRSPRDRTDNKEWLFARRHCV